MVYTISGLRYGTISKSESKNKMILYDMIMLFMFGKYGLPPQIDPVEQGLMSGMLLNHSLVYKKQPLSDDELQPGVGNLRSYFCLQLLLFDIVAVNKIEIQQRRMIMMSP